MCGISGIWSAKRIDLSSQIHSMNIELKHRGPDQNSQWHNFEEGIFLGHTRLSILDITDNGNQPMLSKSGRYTLVFNGEIYNHLEIREEIISHDQSISWRSTSDTETILSAVERWGFHTTCKKLIGMFAIALWDDLEKKLYLARDRIGEKPLYYYRSQSIFAFASEIKALNHVPGFQKKVNQEALSSFIKFSYVPDSDSIYESVCKVEPGSILVISDVEQAPELTYFWSLDSVLNKNLTKRKSKFLKEEYLDLELETEKVLSEVVSSQMISDVPIGSFLSGGIDSSLITMLMQRNSSQPVKSFSIGFEESRFNESEYAAEIANFLGTDHKEFIVSESDALELIPNLADIYDEPFADSSQLPTILLSRLAKKDVTVALTGDGGDEIFGGYNRHLFGPNLWSKISAIPTFIRPIISSGLHLLRFLESKNEVFARDMFVRLGLPITLMERLYILQETIKHATSLKDLHLIVASAFVRPNEITSYNSSILEIVASRIFEIESLNSPEKMMAFDTLTYLPGDILVKVDRASMHSSLETRAPFLDTRIIEHSWKIPIMYKVDKKEGKKILKNILEKHIPKTLIDRPKQGFSIPIDKWIRGDLRDWASSMLSYEKTHHIGIFKPDVVDAILQDHLAGKKNFGQQLWTMLMTHMWFDSNFSKDL